MILTLIVSLLFGLLCVWLLKGTECINTRFITPPVELAHRVFLRKTRRGWTTSAGFGLRSHLGTIGHRLNPDLVAVNAATAPNPDAALEDEEKDAMLRELLDLAHNATDADVRSTFSQYAQEGDDDKAENAAALQRWTEACGAIGLAANSTPVQFHEALLALPKKLKDAADLAANEKKERSKLLLDVAMNDGRLLKPQRAEYETAFNSDFDATAKRLAAETPKLNTTALQLAHRKELASNVREMEQQVEVAVNALMTDKALTYRQAWNAVKVDPKFKSFFEKPEPAAAA